MENSNEKATVDKRLDNLTGTWEPGQSGNPAGYKKGVPHLSTILKAMMSCKAPEKAVEELRKRFPEMSNEKITRAHLYMAKLDEAAIKGQEWALKVIFERTERKPDNMDIDKNDNRKTSTIINIVRDKDE